MGREICWERKRYRRDRRERKKEKYAEREWKWSQIEGGLGIHFKVNFLPILDLIQLCFKFSQKSSLYLSWKISSPLRNIFFSFPKNDTLLILSFPFLSLFIRSSFYSFFPPFLLAVSFHCYFFLSSWSDYCHSLFFSHSLCK